MPKQVILFLAANPVTTSRLALDEEARGIEQELRMSQFREEFVIRSLWAPRPLDLLRGLNEAHPSIVHFAGHGIASKGVILPDDNGGEVLITGDALRRLFERFPHTVRLVVLNACFSQEQCDEVANAIGCAIGMASAVEDAAAGRFAAAFYGALGAGCSISSAFDQAVTLVQIYANSRDEPLREVALKSGNSPEPSAWRPVLRCRNEVDPDRISFVPTAETSVLAISPETDVASVVRAARRAMNTVDERERESAVKLLASTDGAEARAALLEALSHPTKAVRILAARHSSEHGDPRVLRGRIEWLAEEESNLNQWSEAQSEARPLFWAAFRSAGASAVPEILAAVDGADRLPKSLVSDVLVTALVATGDARAAPKLVELTLHESSRVRSAAIDGLARLGFVAAVPRLRALLDDDDHHGVRSRAAMALGRLGDRDAVPALRRLLRRDVKQIRHAAASALSLLRDAAAIPDLLAALTDHDFDTQVAAACALMALDEPAGTAHLRSLLLSEKMSGTILQRESFVMAALIPTGDLAILEAIECRIVKFHSGVMPKEAFEALATSGSAAQAVLIRILDQLPPSHSWSEGAAEVLERVDSPQAAEALTRWRLRR